MFFFMCLWFTVICLLNLPFRHKVCKSCLFSSVLPCQVLIFACDIKFYNTFVILNECHGSPTIRLLNPTCLWLTLLIKVSKKISRNLNMVVTHNKDTKTLTMSWFQIQHESKWCKIQFCTGVSSVVESMLGVRRSVQAVPSAVR